MLLAKKGLGPVVAMSLLLIVAVVATTGFQGWFTNFSSSLFTQTEQKSSSSVLYLDHLEASNVYLRGGIDGNVSIIKIAVDGTDCGVSGSYDLQGSTAVNIGLCTQGTSAGYKDVVVVTDKGIFSEQFYLQVVAATNLSISFAASTTCSTGSEIYGFETVDSYGSHLEISSQDIFTNTLCATHASFTLGNTCAGTYGTLFYLGDVNNSHIWIDNSSAYTKTGLSYNWQEICLSSTGSAVDVVYNSSDMASQGYGCVASYLQNDSVGGVMGNCGTYTPRIWVKLT